MNDKKLVILLVAILASGCASFSDSSYVPTESQLKSRNPYLLRCESRGVPTCKTNGSRIKVSFSN